MHPVAAWTTLSPIQPPGASPLTQPTPLEAVASGHDPDAAVPVSLARNIAGAMPHARVEVIPSGGHRPDIRTPEVVNPLLLDFL